jgi:mannose-6-phosphate isomerase-like protein (cupin superfamily)
MSGVTTKKQPLWFLENLAYVKVDGDETRGAWSIVEASGTQGNMPPLHVHTEADEGFYVLEGRLRVFVGDDELELGPGDCAVAPRGISHVYRVESERARWLAICSPAGFERFVTEVSEPAPEARLPEAPPSIDPERVGEIAARHGIEVLGPPGALPAGR